MLATDHRLAGIPARATGRLDLQVVPAPGVDADELAAAGYADPLLGRLVALDLGHSPHSPVRTGSGAGVLSLVGFGSVAVADLVVARVSPADAPADRVVVALAAAVRAAGAGTCSAVIEGAAG